MMKIKKIFAIVFSLIAMCVTAQTITIDSTFIVDGEIHPFQQNEPIYGISLEGWGILKSDSSLIRVIYTDSTGSEYMIFESYPFISLMDTIEIEKDTITYDNPCDESCSFPCSQPVSIVIHIVEAEFHLDSIILNYDSIPYQEALYLQKGINTLQIAIS